MASQRHGRFYSSRLSVSPSSQSLSKQPIYQQSFKKRYRSVHPRKNISIQEAPDVAIGEENEKFKQLMEVIKNQDSRQQRIFAIEETRMLNEQFNQRSSNQGNINIENLYDHFEKIKEMFHQRKEMAEGARRKAEPNHEERGGSLKHVASVQQIKRDEPIMSEKGDESTNIHTQEFTENKPSRTLRIDDDGFQRTFEKISNMPHSTRNFASKKYALTREPSHQSSASKKFPKNINKGAIKEIDQQEMSMKTTQDKQYGYDGKLPKIRGASFFEKNFSVVNGASKASQNQSRNMSPKEHSEKELPKQYAQSDISIRYQSKDENGSQTKSQARIHKNKKHSRAIISQQHPESAISLNTIEDQSNIKFEHFQIHSKKFSKDDKKNQISLTQGLSAQQKALQDVQNHKEHQANIKNNMHLTSIQSMTSLIDTLQQSQSQRVQNMIMQKVQGVEQANGNPDVDVQYGVVQDHISRGAADVVTLGRSLQESVSKNIQQFQIQKKQIKGHVNGEKNLSENQKLIMTKFIEANEEEQADFIQKKNRFNNLIKHRKAIALLNEIDKYNTKKQGNHQDVTNTVSTFEAEQNAAAAQSIYRKPKTKSFRSKYGEYINENDSDEGELKIFRNLENNEKGTKVEPIKKKQQLPEIIYPFKGTKFENKITNTIEYKRDGLLPNENADGTFDFTKQEQQRINERKQLVISNLETKKQLKGDLSEVMAQGHMLQNLSTYDLEQDQLERQPIYKTMDRQDANKLFKQDFTVKASQMNSRLESEMKGTEQKLSRIDSVITPEPGHLEIIQKTEEEAKKQRESNLKSILVNRGIESSRKHQSPMALGSRRDLSPDASFHLQEGIEIFSPGKSVKSKFRTSMRSNEAFPNKHEEILEQESTKEEGKEEDKEEPKPNKVHGIKMKAPSKAKAEMRAEIEANSDLESVASSVYETPAQERRRLHLEQLRMLQALPREERKAYLKTQEPVELFDEDEEERQNQLVIFMKKLKRNEEFPIETIKALIISKVKEFEDNKDNLEASNLAKHQTTDQLIEGLCLIHCLKNEEIANNFLKTQNKDMLARSAKLIVRASKTLKSFQQAQGDDLNFVNTMRTKNIKSIIKNNGNLHTETGTENDDFDEEQNEMKNRMKYIDELFDNGFFQQVITSILGSKFSNIKYRNQITKDLSSKIGGAIKEGDPADQEGGKSILQYSKVNRTDQSVQMYARRINLQHEFFQICKFADDPKIQKEFENNPLMQYFQNCRVNNALSLPILNRISNKIFPLLNYKLTDGICQSLRDSFKGNKNLINGIVLANNGIRDENFSCILEGLESLSHLKSIILKQNEFGPRSYEKLLTFIQRKKPLHLEELKLIDCKVPSKITTDLLEELNNGRYIQKLSLVNVGFTSATMSALCILVESNRHLKELNISLNNLSVIQLRGFMEIIGKDRKLTHLDLSWNYLMKPEDTVVTKLSDEAQQDIDKTMQLIKEKQEQARLEEIERKKQEEEDKLAKMDEAQQKEYLAAKALEQAETPNGSAVAVTPNTVDEEEYQYEPEMDAAEYEIWRKKKEIKDKLDERNLEIAENICRFIKYNQNLMHLNLSHTFMDKDMIYKVSEAMNKARSLQSLHLSGNPGITDENINFIRKHIVCKDPRPAITINFYDKLWQCSPSKDKALGHQMSVADIHKRHDDFDADHRKDHLQENLKIRQIKETVSINHCKSPLQDSESVQYELVRYLGHQFEMPTSAQWQYFTNFYNINGKLTSLREKLDRNAESNITDDALHNLVQTPHQKEDNEGSCWLCDQRIYTLIFWSESIGYQAAQKLPLNVKQDIIDQLKYHYDSVKPINVENPQNVIEARFANLFQLYESDEMRPLIAGEFTHWEPTRMLRVDEFARSIDQKVEDHKLNLIELMRNENILDKKILTQRYTRLPEHEQKLYQDYKTNMMEQYNINWATILGESLRYKKPFIANGQYLGNAAKANGQEEQLYVFPCFVKPGKQNYIVVQEEELANNMEEKVPLPVDAFSYHIHKEIVESREEAVLPFFKKMKNVIRERQFDQANSVFRDWKPDNQALYDRCLEHDFKCWKVPKFVKDPDELENVKRIIKAKFPILKEVYHFLMSASNFPGIKVEEFQKWILETGIGDEKKGVSLSDVNISYTSALFQEKQDAKERSNPEDRLCRFQFLEAVVRLAKFKYFTNGMEKTFSGATLRMIRDNIAKFNTCDPWQEFRNKELWKIEINDIMEPNLPGLKTVYESYFGARKKYMDKADVISLLTVQTELFVKETDAIQCYGMCKMTCVTETKGSEAIYGQLKFCEFLELIGRIAQLKYQATPEKPEYAQMTLAAKMENVLDAVLEVKDIKRIEPQVTVVDESEPDSDY